MIDKDFLIKAIEAFRREQKSLQLSFERQEGAILFCQKLIQDIENQENKNGTATQDS